MRGSRFDVLDPALELHRNYFLEASAGTGKTFAIENIVARLVKEPPEIDLSEILVVTFTRAATLELKLRIRRKLGRTLSFDEAKIFTIHSFCFHVLQENALQSGLSLEQVEESAAQEELKTGIKDYLRTGISTDVVSPKQLEKVLRAHQNESERLIAHLVNVVSQRLPIETGLPYNALREAILEEVANLTCGDIFIEATHFNTFCNRQKEIKKEYVEGLERVKRLFRGEDVELIDLPLVKMTPDRRKKNAPPMPLWLEAMQKRLIPLLQELSDDLLSFAHLAEGARLHVERVIEKEELFFFEDLLQILSKKVEEPTFAQKIRDTYKAVLIDEFQDTDPLQWKIFSTLFLDEKYRGVLYLVGDPKQSIYRFRQADLYTYMQAKKALGEEALATLDANYRSDPQLIEGLNALFGARDDFMTLPKTKETIPCPPVKAALESTKRLSDGRGPIHLLEAQKEEELFAAIIEEINRLQEEDHFSYSSFAVLVKDRFQAMRFAAYSPLPTALQKSRNLIDSNAYPTLCELLQAVLNPRERSATKRVLAGPLFGKALSQLTEEDFAPFYHYHHLLEVGGILPLFERVVRDATLRDESLYHDLIQLVEIVVDAGLSIDEYLPFLHSLRQEDPEAEMLRARGCMGAEAIQVMTIHVSKGLEFDVVFPIGLSVAPMKRRHFVRGEKRLHLSDNASDLEEAAERMRLLYVACTRAKERLYLPLIHAAKAPLNHFLEKIDLTTIPHLTRSSCEGATPIFEKKQQKLVFAERETILVEPALVQSYSSLADHDEERERITPTEGDLPPGPETGTLLHTILEKGGDIPSMLAGTHLEGWEERVTQMVERAFSVELPAPTGAFSLSIVKPEKIMKEMEFLFPQEKNYIKGFIDLIFEHAGKIYILDWKSNDLGGDYTEQKMHQAMLEHEYFLQARLYKEALMRFLSSFETPPVYGGAFYFFLRATRPNEGIYYVG